MKNSNEVPFEIFVRRHAAECFLEAADFQSLVEAFRILKQWRESLPIATPEVDTLEPEIGFDQPAAMLNHGR